MRNRLTFAGFVILSVGFATVGLAAEPEPTVKDFLATCAKARASESTRVYDHKLHRWNLPHSVSYIDCTNAVTFGFAQSDDACLSASTSTDDGQLAIVKWLSDRPEMFNMGETDGIRAAIAALYHPCRH